MLKSLFLSACGLYLAGTVNVARAAVVLSDDFTYADGALTNVSSGKWMAHSGTNALPVDVVGGKIVLKQANAEDVSALLDGQPYSLTNVVQLYASFKVSFSVLPAAGAYFAHFKDTSTGFRARLFATTNGAGSGAFRLAIASTTGVVSNAVPTGDLNLNTDYVVVCRLILSNAVSTLWINPSSETDASVTSTDSATPIVVTSYAFRQPTQNNGMGTLTVDDLRVGTEFSDVVSGSGGGGNGPPVIILQPSNQTVTDGQTATFSVGATGAEPLNFQWQFNSTNLVGATNAALVLAGVTTNQAGAYRVAISNVRGSTNSDPATLTVLPRPLATVTNIAFLRTLVDAQTFAPTDTTTLYAAEGIVTTYVNLTTAANASFYMQDSTAGIDVFVSGSTTIRPNAGDRVRVTGPLGHFNGLLEFNMSAANSAHTVVTLSTNNPLPVPRPLAFSLQTDPALIEPLEGSLVVVSNVFLDVTQPNFPPPSDAAGVGGGGNVTMTNSLGETFVLRVDGRVRDITGQPKPTVPVTIIGVLAQFDGSSPYTTGYQLTPTRFADIIGGTVAPKIEFTNVLALIRLGDAPTNTFIEHVLLPGERITTTARAFDAQGGQVTISALTNGLPAGATWNFSSTQGTNVVATFTYQATTNAAGQPFTVRLHAANAQATNSAVWSIYVPTAIEQRITVSEFLANAPGPEVTPYPNILNRPGQPPAQNSDDEFVELVNLSSQDVDLLGWTISDSVQMRHKFYESRMIGASNALVVYGGPLNGFVPQLDVPVLPASENIFGFGLNNTGGDSILLRNAQTNLITRVVFSLLPTNSTMTRFLDMNGNFVGQLTVSTNAGSPGRQFDGKLFSEPPSVTPPAALNVAAALVTSATVRLTWNAESGRTYSVLRADNVSGPFNSVATGLTFTTAAGEYIDPLNATALARFYRISTP